MAIRHSHIGVVVNDLDRVLPFWTGLMGLEEARSIPGAAGGAEARVRWLRLGHFNLELIDYARKDRKLDVGAMDVHSTHMGFFCDSVPEQYRRISSQGIWFRSVPIDWGNNQSMTTYGRDPDGNWFELISIAGYEDVALPVPAGRLAHSHAGIVVNNRDAAMRFWRDVMGFQHVRSIERVPDPKEPPKGNHLDGVHVRVDWLRLADFQIELVDFVNRKEKSLDVGVADVGATHVAFSCDDVRKEYERLRSCGVWFRSPPMAWPEAGVTAAYGRDPDGNWFELISEG